MNFEVFQWFPTIIKIYANISSFKLTGFFMMADGPKEIRLAKVFVLNLDKKTNIGKHCRPRSKKFWLIFFHFSFLKETQNGFDLIDSFCLSWRKIQRCLQIKMVTLNLVFNERIGARSCHVFCSQRVLVITSIYLKLNKVLKI
jgi:hypothetical protein